jgi:hypothetical protein
MKGNTIELRVRIPPRDRYVRFFLCLCCLMYVGALWASLPYKDTYQIPINEIQKPRRGKILGSIGLFCHARRSLKDKMRTEQILDARKEIWRIRLEKIFINYRYLMNNFFVPISTCLNNMETVYMWMHARSVTAQWRFHHLIWSR